MDFTPMGLRKTPFTREIRIEELQALDFQRAAADALLEAVNQRMSASLVAPAGTGKTLVLRMLRSQLPEARTRTRTIKVTGLSKRDLCRRSR